MARRTRKYDYGKTMVLEILRDEVAPDKLTLDQMASYFDLQDRRTVRDWELGFTRPSERKYRALFIVYLQDILQLYRNPERLSDVWREVMEDLWRWQPLSPEERRSYLSDSAFVSEVEDANQPIYMAPRLPVYDLIGRKELVETIRRDMLAGNNVALSGIPGVGKTVLAVCLANDRVLANYFRDGVLWARLGRKADTLSQLRTWGRLLNITSKDIDDPTNPYRWSEAINNAIGGRRFILVADDVWDINDALVFAVGGKGCTHIITTRLPEIATRFAGDRERIVTELDDKNGLLLLRNLAPRVVDSEVTEAENLVKSVGGLPLSLVIMGNYLRTKLRTGQPRLIQSALSSLQSAEMRLRLSEPQSPIYQHPSLPLGTPISVEAVIAVSDDALNAAAQATLRAVSVLPAKPNSFSEEAGIAISGEPVQCIDTLLDFGLLESSDIERYTLHQTIADFARQRLTDKDAYIRIVNYYSGYIEQHQQDYEQIELDLVNITEAINIAYARELTAAFVQAVNALSHFLTIRGMYATAEDYLNRASQIARHHNDPLALTKILLNLGRVNRQSGNYELVSQYSTEGLELAKQLKHLEISIAHLMNLGSAAYNLGNYANAQEYWLEGMVLADNIDSTQERIDILRGLTMVAMNQGNYVLAAQYGEEGLRIARELKDDEKVSALLLSLSWLAYQLGEYEQVEAYCNEGLTIAEEDVHNERIIAFLINLGAISVSRGDFSHAETLFQRGLVIAEDIKHQVLTSIIFADVGWTSIKRKDYARAKLYLQDSIDIARKIGHREIMSFFLSNMGTVMANLENLSVAEDYFSEALSIARDIGHTWYVNVALLDWAEAQLQYEEYSSSSIKFSEVLETAQQIGLREQIALAVYGLARVSYAAGNVKEASVQASQSLADFEAIGHYRANEVMNWLRKLPSQDAV